MAKRSVRKQRRTAVNDPGRVSGPPSGAPAVAGPAWRSPAFWLGGLVFGFAVAAIAVAIVVARGGDETAAPAAATPQDADTVKSAETLEAEFGRRDKEQIEELTVAAEDGAAQLQPVMRGLEKALPHDGGPSDQVSAEQVQDWLDTARDVAAPYQESISGSTGHNVARNAIRAALDGLVTAIETYRLAGEPGADVEALHAQAAAQRDNAIRTWSTAGIQVDAINIEAGFGHQHIAQLGGPAAGAQPPDTLPEGTDAHPEE